MTEKQIDFEPFISGYRANNYDPETYRDGVLAKVKKALEKEQANSYDEILAIGDRVLEQEIRDNVERLRHLKRYAHSIRKRKQPFKDRLNQIELYRPMWNRISSANKRLRFDLEQEDRYSTIESTLKRNPAYKNINSGRLRRIA